MIFLSQVTKISNNQNSYPFSVPAIKSFESISFTTPITFLIGENGSGKSTFIESLAIATSLPTIGSKPANLDKTLLSEKLLAESLKLSWKPKTHKGFFVRSEDVFGFTKYLADTKTALASDINEFSYKFTGYGRKLAMGTILGQKNSLEKRYGNDLDANSHGETFLKVFSSRFVPGGLYLLDEPETPLSFKNQLALIVMLREMIQKDSQFIIVTHSPILSAIPEASIFSFNDDNIHRIRYSEIEAFQLTRDFLNCPEIFLKHL